MKITRLWIVTTPTKYSTLQDICFQADIYDLEKQFKGGLKAEDVVGMYLGQSPAEEKAKFLIHREKTK
jgi:hypothetical protein